MTTSPNKMSDDLRAFRKIYQSRALAVFRKDGEPVAYGWSWESLKPELEQLIKQHREAYADEAKLDFANDMLKMNKRNEQARTDELYKIIRKLREKKLQKST